MERNGGVRERLVGLGYELLGGGDRGQRRDGPFLVVQMAPQALENFSASRSFSSF